MPGTRVPLHLGGPLGVVGAGLILGAGALFVTSLRGNDDGKADFASVTSPEAPATGLPPPADMPAIADGQAEPEPDTGETPVEIAGSAPGLAADPIVRPQQAGGVALPASAGDAEVIFILRLKGEPEIDTITQTFKRDRPTAEAAFLRLAEKVPTLADFTLVGASYSGEIRVSYRMTPAQPPTPAAIAAIKDRLLEIEGVAYVDPDYVAHPGKDSPQ